MLARLRSSRPLGAQGKSGTFISAARRNAVSESRDEGHAHLVEPGPVQPQESNQPLAPKRESPSESTSLQSSCSPQSTAVNGATTEGGVAHVGSDPSPVTEGAQPSTSLEYLTIPPYHVGTLSPGSSTSGLSATTAGSPLAAGTSPFSVTNPSFPEATSADAIPGQGFSGWTAG